MVVKKATIKQAKADYKTRGRPSLSDLEKRQLERSIQLDRRAWGIQEREKRKAEATLKKKQERERLELGRRRVVQMGSQRRCDRFGYKSSQFHLKRFFGCGGAKRDSEEAVAVEDEGFGDEGLDDDTLLEALGSPSCERESEVVQVELDISQTVKPPIIKISTTNVDKSADREVEDVCDFWDELESSTQIARELDDGEDQPQKQQTPSAERAPMLRGGTVTIDFARPISGVTIPATKGTTIAADRKLMPPPALPQKCHFPAVRVMNPPHKTSFIAPQLPPPIPAVNAVHPSFSLSELENFVDDDLQLTQMAPG
ncbi:hypothetical protein LTR62_005768 [Meristemomyces frigidus]|uniref:Uncharacterized protein n=1 Tax=Meristemomyces frigidus TaxID=1508187 RepID=A0AAN7TD82_9PEZI|nr:hypothetical protein LTR62_005768 [Meristemomyces frigidus]